MPYGTIKVDTITFTAGGADTSVSISGLVRNPTFTGNITSTGTISGNIIQGGTTVSGATVTGTAGQFGTLTGNTAAFTTLTGGVATFTSGVFASGTQALPSISFVNDPNTGIFSPAADEISFGVNGVEALNISSSGRIRTTLFGSNSAPIYTFASDPDTGMYRDNPNELAFAAGGIGRLFVTSTGVNTLLPFAVPSGTAAAPSVAFNNDLDTGLFSSAANTVAITTSGAGKVFITPTGNVGIGLNGTITDNFSAKLVISGNTNTFAGMAKIYLIDSGNTDPDSRNWSLGNGGSANGDLNFSCSTTTGGNPGDATSISRFVVKSDGRYGFNTITPTRITANTTSLTIGTSGTANGCEIHFTTPTFNGVDQGGNISYLESGAVGNTEPTLYLANRQTGPIEFYTRAIDNVVTQRLVITSGGQLRNTNLGSPTIPQISFVSDSDTGLYSPTDNTLAIATAGTTKFRVNSYGNACISTSGEFAFGTSETALWNVSGVGLAIHNPLSAGNAPAEIRFTNGRTGAQTTSSGGLITFYDNDFYFFNATPGKVVNIGVEGDTRARFTSSGTILGVDKAEGATATPHVLSIGRSYSNSAGNNAKLRVWESSFGSSDYMGLGVSAGQFDFIARNTNYDFVYYAGTSTTEVLRIKGTGGIQFPATQLTSSDANTLDDYEEGLFSPTAFGSLTAGTTTYALQFGVYVKIGQICHYQVRMQVTNMTGTGDILFGGLPFTAMNDNERGYGNVTINYLDSLPFGNAADTHLVCYVNQNSTNIVVRSSGNNRNSTAVPVDTGFTILYGGTYRTAN